MTPAACKFPSLPGGNLPDTHSAVGNRITGKLFGYRKGRPIPSGNLLPGFDPSTCRSVCECCLDSVIWFILEVNHATSKEENTNREKLLTFFRWGTSVNHLHA
ncbi:Uncharacterized protein Fot_10638 [Forsythia ovata]|uniref:Uncharacterized protein n=1 Tax=Forsythia ovata TaxID=205694 RepID=A0ABD1WK81_9LAMI